MSCLHCWIILCYNSVVNPLFLGAGNAFDKLKRHHACLMHRFLVSPSHQQARQLLWDLTHWGRMTHICVSRLTITGSDNGLSPGRRQAIIWTNAGILLTGPLGTNFSENLIEILTFSFRKMLLKVSSAKWRPFCLDLNVLNLSMAQGKMIPVTPSGRFNIKTPSYQCMNSYYRYKTNSRPSGIYNRNSDIGRTASWYWINTLR